MYILGYKAFLNFFINVSKVFKSFLTGSLKIMSRSRSVNDRFQNTITRKTRRPDIGPAVCQSVVRFGYFYLHLATGSEV